MSWEELERRLDEDAAALFDTVEFTVKPRTDGATVNHRPGPDDTRAEFPFEGSIEFNPPMTRGATPDQASGAYEGVNSFDAVVTAHDDGWAYVPRRRDHLATHDATYEVGAIHRDGSNRRVFYVNRAK
ncbi:MAG: hypothetical protein CML29_17465 [Rhizobiales bacterium]|nr:hypothetical protein [Hyphomicrobiales bacterium]MBA68629.1 hypothetical protein [Hyphomicrobiales bacterium]|tara:strand:- start:80 stop:463 length:384 start_codon:yes stop_codon:yes gene_type:complete